MTGANEEQVDRLERGITRVEDAVAKVVRILHDRGLIEDMGDEDEEFVRWVRAVQWERETVDLRERITDLHAAARALDAVQDAVDAILTAAAPFMARYYDERATIPRTGDEIEDQADNLLSYRHGYSAFHLAADQLAQLAGSVEDADVADSTRRFLAS